MDQLVRQQAIVTTQAAGNLPNGAFQSQSGLPKVGQYANGAVNISDLPPTNFGSTVCQVRSISNTAAFSMGPAQACGTYTYFGPTLSSPSFRSI